MVRWWIVALSVLAGSGWLLTQAYPGELGFPFAGCIHFALIAVSGLLFGMRGMSARGPLRSSAAIAAAGGCVFLLPGVVLQLTAGGIPPFTSVALFCSIPVIIIGSTSAFGSTVGRSTLLWPALGGLFGALLLFPFALPQSPRQTVCFAAVAGCCVLVGLASVVMHDLLSEIRMAQAVAVIGATGALSLALYGAILGWPQLRAAALLGEAARCMAFDMPFVWLLVWLMRDADPTRLSARFLLAPLVTFAENYAIERGQLDLPKLSALALMVAGSAMLLLKDETEEVPGLGLR